MQAASIPSKFPVPFGASAAPANIRPIPQNPSGQLGAASLTLGFPPACFTAIAAGGSWPFGEDFNGLLNQMTAWDQWIQAGGPILYDVNFALAIGGYAQRGMVASAVAIGAYWISLVDNNQTNPDAGPAQFTASTSGTQMTVTSIANGILTAGQTLTGSGAAAGTVILGQVSGLAGGTGVYTLNIGQTISGVINAGGSANWLQFPAKVKLRSSTIFYVATTGSDTTGTGTQANPWRTRTFAYNTIQSLYDIGGLTVTIQLVDGTYTDPFSGIGGIAGQSSPIIFQGNNSFPTNVVINASTALGCFAAGPGTNIQIQGMTLTTTTNACLYAYNGGNIFYTNILFGSSPGCGHVTANQGGNITQEGACTITGGAATHKLSNGAGSNITSAAGGVALNLSGTPNFTTAFAQASNLAFLASAQDTITGAATGKRFDVSFNAVINNANGNINFFPGNAVGTQTSGGQYN